MKMLQIRVYQIIYEIKCNLHITTVNSLNSLFDLRNNFNVECNDRSAMIVKNGFVSDYTYHKLN